MKEQSTIEKLKCGFYSDLDLYEKTGKEIYLICAEYTLNKILKKGYRGVYQKLVAAHPTVKGSANNESNSFNE
jgi:hypothetical protein